MATTTPSDGEPGEQVSLLPVNAVVGTAVDVPQFVLPGGVRPHCYTSSIGFCC